MVTVTDIAEQPRPEVRRYSVEVRGCRQCGRKMRGRHADIAPRQHGATAHRVGARLKAMARTLCTTCMVYRCAKRPPLSRI